MRILLSSLAAVLMLVLLPDAGEARTHNHRHAVHHHRHHMQVSYHRRRAAHRHRHHHRHMASPRGAGCRSGLSSLDCVTPVLAAKGREIVAACGSIITSAVAHRAYRSNHPIGRALDLVGNPRCIYAHLKGWPGGYSTDYGAVRHVHISYNPGGQEWGVRFAHGGHRHGGTMIARARVRGRPVAPQYATALPDRMSPR